jgi:hypothetical protein
MKSAVKYPFFEAGVQLIERARLVVFAAVYQGALRGAFLFSLFG